MLLLVVITFSTIIQRRMIKSTGDVLMAVCCPGPGGANPVGWRRWLGYAVLIFFALVFIFPFVLALASSFKTLPDIQANPGPHSWPTPSTGGGPLTASGG